MSNIKLRLAISIVSLFFYIVVLALLTTILWRFI
nr:MAG TPA: Acrosome formation-associated factor [Caudoviricetes sp.]